MKFLVPNYRCLQNPWLGGLPPPDSRSLCPQLNLLTPPPAEQNSWVCHWFGLSRMFNWEDRRTTVTAPTIKPRTEPRTVEFKSAPSVRMDCSATLIIQQRGSPCFQMANLMDENLDAKYTSYFLPVTTESNLIACSSFEDPKLVSYTLTVSFWRGCTRNSVFK